MTQKVVNAQAIEQLIQSLGTSPIAQQLKELLADSYEAVAYNDCAYLVTTDDIKTFAEAHETTEEVMEEILFDNNCAGYLDEELNNFISCNLPDDED